jgi:hypothetical protein
MKVFECPACSGRLFFHSLRCTCGTEVAFNHQRQAFEVLQKGCDNRPAIDCNWTATDGFCRSCGMTKLIPDTFHDKNVALWAEAEQAKRWVLATLVRWGWFTDTGNGPDPVFHLLSEATAAGGAQVMMGHAAGVVTINVSEADPVERIQRRQDLGEVFRTMMGHFRHELGHFIFERLSERQDFSDRFRSLFGDERSGYGQALERHYNSGPPDGWSEVHVTAYASSHPHEDWAESFAHLLHLTDIADSFSTMGLSAPTMPHADYDAYAETDPGRLIRIGAELGIALNHVNRAMGLPDIYPFVLTPVIREKLAFVHESVWQSR